MAGKNRILMPNQILFKEGDHSDGMYLIRRGNLQIFLDKGGVEIPLAKVGPGAMVGEMALFDKKPRSASARAIDEIEVTLINNEDFNKILKQIPKWFVTLMATLSARLRDTNEKLQSLEAQYKGNINPLEELLKILHIFHLLFYKIGEKEVKTWTMERASAEAQIETILGFSLDTIRKTTKNLVSGGLVNLSKNRYKADVFVVTNRGTVEKFIEFVHNLRQANPLLKTLPQEIVDITEILLRKSEKSAYESLTISMNDLKNEAVAFSFRTDDWHKYVKIFEKLEPSTVELVVNGEQYSFKVNKKLIGRLASNCKLLLAIIQSQTTASKAA